MFVGCLVPSVCSMYCHEMVDLICNLSVLSIYILFIHVC